MSAKFIIKTRNNGEYDFSLHAPNGERILYSIGYSSHSACLNGIESVRKNSEYEDRFIRHSNSLNKESFWLIASNRQTIGYSESYESVSARENGIMSVIKNASNAIIEDKIKIEEISNINIKAKAKEIVNSFYQPLGKLKEFSNSNSAQMWKHAQSCAKTAVTLFLNENFMVSNDLQFWQKVLKEIDKV